MERVPYEALPQEARDQIKAMWQEGVHYRDIATEVGCAVGTVFKHCKGLRPVKRRKQQRLTDAEIAEMQRLKAEGLRMVDIMKVMAVSETAVRKHCGPFRKCPDIRKEAQELWASGRFKNRRQIAQAMGVPLNAVHKALMSMGQPLKPHETDPKVLEEVLMLYKTGAYTQGELAKKLRLPKSWICRHTKGIWPAGNRMERPYQIRRAQVNYVAARAA